MRDRTRLVIAVSAHQVAMALSVRDVIILEDVRDRSGPETLESIARQLVDRIAVSNSGRTTIDVLVCRPFASRKALFGVAATARVEEVRSILRDAPHAHFLGEDGSIAAGEPRLIDGAWWASAVNRDVLASLMRALEPIAMERCRFLAIDEPSEPRTLVMIVRNVASRPTIDPLALDPLAGARRARGERRRLRLLAGTLLVGLAATAMGPAVLHAAFARREAAELQALRLTVNSDHEWARSQTVKRLDDDARLARLTARAPLRTPLVGSLGRALPDSAIVLSLAVDSTAGTLVVLAPPGEDVLHALSRIPGISDPRLAGAVTRERLSERAVNRTTISFRLAPPEGIR